jgi:hypothetical protein
MVKGSKDKEAFDFTQKKRWEEGTQICKLKVNLSPRRTWEQFI